MKFNADNTDFGGLTRIFSGHDVGVRQPGQTSIFTRNLVSRLANPRLGITDLTVHGSSTDGNL